MSVKSRPTEEEQNLQQHNPNRINLVDEAIYSQEDFNPYENTVTPTNFTLFEICKHVGENPQTFTNAETDIEKLQAISRSEKVLFEIFVRMARGEKTSHLFGERQLKYLHDNQFSPDIYSTECPPTSIDIGWRISELFRCWNATNIRALNLGLTPAIIEDQTYKYYEVYKLILENAFPNRLPLNPFDNFNYDEEPKIIPIIFDPKKSQTFAAQNVRFFIDNVCILIPLPTRFLTYTHNLLYLNELAYMPFEASKSPKYVVETIIKTIVAGLSLEKSNPKGILSNQIPNLWEKYKTNLLRRHLIPEHNLNAHKGINFLKHTGLTWEQIDKIRVEEYVLIFNEALKSAKKIKQQEQKIRIRPDGSFKREKKQPTPKRRSKKKNIFALELPGLD